MRKTAALAALLVITAATFGVVVTAPEAEAVTTCPESPAPGSTVTGRLVVPPGQSCFLNHVTVTGSVTVGDGASLSMVNGSHVQGTVTIGSSASLYVNNSAIDGSLNATNGPQYITIVGSNGGIAQVGNSANIVGAMGADGQAFEPAVFICGATISGGLTVNNTAAAGGGGFAQPQFPGSANVVIGGDGCRSQIEQGAGEFGASNSIGNSANLRNNQGHVSFDNNTVGESVLAFWNSGGGDIVGNTIGNSLRCGSNSPTFFSSGNTFHGANTCGNAPPP